MTTLLRVRHLGASYGATKVLHGLNISLEKGQVAAILGANGAGKTWTSVRHHDPRQLSISFRQERAQYPLGDMGGVWIVEPVSESECHVRLPLHRYLAARWASARALL